MGIIWKENTEANTNTARSAAHELARIITGSHELTEAQSEGYSNYGAFVLPLGNRTIGDQPHFRTFQMPRLSQVKKTQSQIKRNSFSQKTIPGCRKSRSSMIQAGSSASGSQSLRLEHDLGLSPTGNGIMMMLCNLFLKSLVHVLPVVVVAVDTMFTITIIKHTCPRPRVRMLKIFFLIAPLTGVRESEVSWPYGVWVSKFHI